MMHVSEYDLFQGHTFAGDPNTPLVVCTGPNVGCGSVVANTFDARRLHVDFHNRVPDES